jgi:hypothetical protein
MSVSLSLTEIRKCLVLFMLAVLTFNIPFYSLTQNITSHCQDLWEYVQYVTVYDSVFTMGYVTFTLLLTYVPTKSWLSIPIMILSYLFLALDIGTKGAAVPFGLWTLSNTMCPLHETLITSFYFIYNTVSLTVLLLGLRIL